MYECTEETREEVEIVRLPLRLNPSAPSGTVAPLPQPPIDGNKTQPVPSREAAMFRYDAKVGDAAPLGKSVAPPSEAGADAAALDELRGFLQGRRRRREGRWDFTRKLNKRRQTMGGRRIWF